VETPADEFQVLRDRCDVRRVHKMADLDTLFQLPLAPKQVQQVARKTKLSKASPHTGRERERDVHIPRRMHMCRHDVGMRGLPD
jgi:hypothetical protein